MWHAVAPVAADYDPILYESPVASNALVLNAGPGSIVVRAWVEIDSYGREPQIAVELRPGDQRTLGGRLIRARLLDGKYAAIAWHLLSAEVRQ
ncbi:MAG: hypothetical protein AAB403_22835 [Planctomycetota bacterium]